MNNNSIKKFDKIPVEIFSTSQEASKKVANEIAHLIQHKRGQGERCVLGLATGSTPIQVYNELVRLHQDENLSFKNVITFNLDEYYPIDPNSIQSYNRYMREYLFDHVDLDTENINIPSGNLPKKEIADYCEKYEKSIEAFGGIDIQILGIGRTGHIGFNEPGSSINSLTRLITLDDITLTDAANDFYGKENVPTRAITMGINTILKSKRIILLAWGETKASIIKETVEGKFSESVPATVLQNHPNTSVFLDEASSADLTRIKTPWLVQSCNWDDRLIRKSVIWLSQKENKAILKLTERHYNENGMSDLVAEKGPANKINIKVFNDLQHTITGWPGGKPNTDDSFRPVKAEPYPKNILVFSPHPDDDVISMGGTLKRLVEQGHKLHIAYQTSGNIAVFDDYVVQFIDFVKNYKDTFKLNFNGEKKIYEDVIKFFNGKKPAQIDSQQVQILKSLIRENEARAACRFIGIPQENIYFLKMPFYETGDVKKKPLSNDDINIIVKLLKDLKPDQIFAAGDLSDPHGTHRLCLNAIFNALDLLKNETWVQDCYIWLYRGAWQEWELEKVNMAVPLSPSELNCKRGAIFKHQSQKDRPLFPGFDNREFWQRTEDRNRATAVKYDKLGMAEYEAMEVFSRYKLL